MKKVTKNLLIITAMLCLFFAFGGGKITSRAATGDLYTGSKFSETIKAFTNSKVDWVTDDRTIKRIVFAKSLPSTAKASQKKAVGDGVTAYYDSNDNTVYVCCSAKMRFNSSCERMFCRFKALESIDFGKNLIDTTNMTSASTMFRECSSLVELDLSQFKTPKLKNMCQMFHCCSKLKKLNVSTLDTSNVTDMQSVFMTCPSLEYLDVSNFNTSKVTWMFQMFSLSGKLKSLDLSNFDTSNVTDMYRMFDGDHSLTSLNVSSFKTPKVTRVQEMFYGCNGLKYLNLSGFDLSNVSEEDAGGFLGRCDGLLYVDGPGKVNRNFSYDADTRYVKNCQIGKVALDDNKDGKQDSSATYNYFLKATKPHRYLFIDNIAKAKQEEDEKKKDENEAPSPVSESSASTKDASVTPSESVDNSVPAGKAVLPATVTVSGVTYYIDATGKATVIRLDKIKKVSINKVNYEGTTYPVVSIKDGASKGNRKLSSLSIGSNVKKIGKKAFYKCKKLKKVKITANKSLKIGKNSFGKIHNDAKITVKGIKGKAKEKLIKKIKS